MTAEDRRRRATQLALSFFCTWRLMSSARRDRSSALALIRKASRPPRRSTVFNALVEIRSLTERPSASDIMVTLTRLGRKRRLVFMFEWLTVCPTCAPFPVNSQRRDMLKTSRFRRLRPRARRMKHRGLIGPRTYREPGERRQAAEAPAGRLGRAARSRNLAIRSAGWLFGRAVAFGMRRLAGVAPVRPRSR